MLPVDPLTASLVGLIFVAVLVASVLFILQCGECGRQNEYEQLADDKAEKLAAATSAQQIKQVELDKQQQSKNITEVLYYIRSLPGSQLLTDYKLWGMGWRPDKTNFLASFQEHVNIISLVKKGANCALPWNRQGKEVFVKILTSIKHPNIQLITKPDILFDEGLAIVLSFFSPEGSLRDKIFSCEPTNTWSKKYHPANGNPLSNRDIAKYGWNILEGLRFLQASKIPFTHLHSGNVIVRSGTARLTQIENGLLNVERQNEVLFRQFYNNGKVQVQSPTDLDVLAFGFILFEMASGKLFKNFSQLDEVKNISPDVQKIIDFILRNPEKKIPTVQELLNNPFFASASSSSTQIPDPIVFDKKVLFVLKEMDSAARDLVGVFKPNTTALSPASSRRVKAANRASQQPTEQPYRGFEPGPNQPVRAQSTTISTQPTPAAQPAKPQPNSPPPVSSQPNSPPAQRTQAPAAAPTPRATVPSPAPTPQPKPAAVPPPPAQRGGAVPPPPAQRGGPAPPQPEKVEVKSQPNALLSSIEAFAKTKLKKTVTNDRSAPVF